VNTQSDYEWIYAPSENLNAEQNLRNKLSLLVSQCGSGNLNLDSTVSQGTQTYYLTSWTTWDSGNLGLIEIWHDAYAEISYHELNARFTPSVSVPEMPAWGMVISVLFTVFAVFFNMKRRKGE